MCYNQTGDISTADGTPLKLVDKFIYLGSSVASTEKDIDMDSNKTAGEEARRQLHKNAASNLEQVLAATPHKTPTVWPPTSYHENYTS